MRTALIRKSDGEAIFGTYFDSGKGLYLAPELESAPTISNGEICFDGFYAVRRPQNRAEMNACKVLMYQNRGEKGDILGIKRPILPRPV